MLLHAQTLPNGRTLQLRFPIVDPGTYSLQVILISDYWIGADVKHTIKLKVLKRTKEIMQSRKEAIKYKLKKNIDSLVQGNIDMHDNAHVNASKSDLSDSDTSCSAGVCGGDYPQRRQERRNHQMMMKSSSVAIMTPSQGAGKEWPKIASIESDAPGSISSTQESLNLHSSETNVEETDEQQEEQTTATSTHRATS